MKVNNVELNAVAVGKKQYPETDLQEIAFCGKSNVGKSSLINTMVGRKAIARTSQTPGKTRTINFYLVTGAENSLYFVDLPGYGYAKTSRSESEKWGKMIEDYLMTRKQIKKIVLLIDMRHVPGQNDKMMYDWLKYYKRDCVIAATKSDKLPRSQVQRQLRVIAETLGISETEHIVPFSSLKKTGIDELWAVIEN